MGSDGTGWDGMGWVNRATRVDIAKGEPPCSLQKSHNEVNYPWACILVEGCSVGKGAGTRGQVPKRNQSCARNRRRLGRPPNGGGRRLRRHATGRACQHPPHHPPSPPPRQAASVEDAGIVPLRCLFLLPLFPLRDGLE